MANKKICELDKKANLDSFIQNDIQADQDFIRSANEAIDAVTRVLHGSTFPYDVAEVLKTGSMAQGTALKRGLSDIDLVVYLNDHTVEGIIDNVDTILKRMHMALKGLPGYIHISRDGFRLGIRLNAAGETFEIDLLPGVKVSDDLEDTYKMLRRKNANFQKHYSLTFAKQQKEFIKGRDTKLKSLFQVLKYWSKVDMKSYGCKKFPSYRISLIAIHTWEEYGKPPHFKTVIAFKAVLETLVNYQKIQKVWFENYNSKTWEFFKPSTRYYLIDPADPAANELEDNKLDSIARAAQGTLRSPLLRDIEITRNWQ